MYEVWFFNVCVLLLLWTGVSMDQLPEQQEQDLVLLSIPLTSTILLPSGIEVESPEVPAVVRKCLNNFV